jgi:hypothetical protein
MGELLEAAVCVLSAQSVREPILSYDLVKFGRWQLKEGSEYQRIPAVIVWGWCYMVQSLEECGSGNRGTSLLEVVVNQRD